MRVVKILGVGVLNFLGRFVVGGVLMLGLGVNPESFAFGFVLAAVAFLAAYLLLRYVMKPETRTAAVRIALVWAGIALLLDIVTAEPIVRVSVSYLLFEPQTWTRLLVIPLAATLLPSRQRLTEKE